MRRLQFALSLLLIVGSMMTATATISVAMIDVESDIVRSTKTTASTNDCPISLWACGVETCMYEVARTGPNYVVSINDLGTCDEEACAGDGLGFTILSPCGFDDIVLIANGVKVIYNEDETKATFEMINANVGTLEIQLPYDDIDPSTTGCGDWYLNTNTGFPSRSKEFTFRCTEKPYEYTCTDDQSIEICIDNTQEECVECLSASLHIPPVNGLNADILQPTVSNTTSKCFQIPLQNLISGTNVFTLEWDGNDCPFGLPCLGGGVEVIEFDYDCDCFTEEDQTTDVCEFLEPKRIVYDAQSHCGDSIVYMTYNVLPSDTSYIIEITCEETPQDTLFTGDENGCSVRITTFEVMIPDTTSLVLDVCEYQKDTIKYLTNIAGCDSIVTISYVLLPSDTTYLKVSTCDPRLKNTVDTVLQFNHHGCDSLIITSYEVNPRPRFGIVQDPRCGEGTVIEVISEDAQTLSVQWENTNTIHEDGDVSFRVSNEFGCSVDTSILVVYFEEPRIELGTDRTLNLGESFTLRFESSDHTVLFDSDEVDIERILKYENGRFQPIQETTIFAQIITDDGCEATDEITISIEQEGIHDVYIPNAFSPNGDGINDRFTVFTEPNAAKITELSIFDRGGNQVFFTEHIETSHEQQGWNGEFRGKQTNGDVFVYRAILTFIDGTVIIRSGDITRVP